MTTPITIVKSDGTRQPFDEDKLAGSLQRAGAPSTVIDSIVEEIEHGLRDGMKTEDIYRHAFQLLKKRSHHVAARYSIRRALFDLGPDGFPFEKFVARLFKVWGYEALTDQTVMGSCIPHEIDVIAWNKEKLVMVEAKFHNDFGLKSDAKVALYVNARREDVLGIMYDYGGIKRVPTEFWLVTNTKFSDQAIHYSECKGLKLIGWNYPDTGNLHDLIEKHGMQPITCLASLTHDQKKDLIGKNVLVCADIVAKPDVLKDVGVKDEKAVAAVEEAKLVLSGAA